eukprot:Pgem_evm1s17265
MNGGSSLLTSIKRRMSKISVDLNNNINYETNENMMPRNSLAGDISLNESLTHIHYSDNEDDGHDSDNNYENGDENEIGIVECVNINNNNNNNNNDKQKCQEIETTILIEELNVHMAQQKQQEIINDINKMHDGKDDDIDDMYTLEDDHHKHNHFRRYLEHKSKMERQKLWYYFLWWLCPLAWNVVMYVNMIYKSVNSNGQVDNDNFDYNQNLTLLFIGINFFVTCFSRNEFFVWTIYKINVFFVRTFLMKTGFPRQFLNNLTYNIGGLHTGSVFFLLVTYFTHVVLIIRFYTYIIINDDPDDAKSIDIVVAVLTFIVFFGLLIVSVVALPIWRHKQLVHDYFEFSHRYIGWFLSAIILTQILYEAFTKSFGNPFAIASTYLLLASIGLIFWPWIVMMKCKVKLYAVSKLVTIISMDKPFFAAAGTAGKTSLSYFGQYHAFAVLNDLNGDKRKATMAVSSVGNWTKALNQKGQVNNNDNNEKKQIGKTHLANELIKVGSDNNDSIVAIDDTVVTSKEEDNYVERTMYVRRFALPGFMYLARTYKRVLCIGTGAGIAPIAAYLPTSSNFMSILWVGREFETTYGALYDLVKQHENLVMVDTRKPNSYNNPYFVGDEQKKKLKELDDQEQDQQQQQPVMKKERPDVGKLALALVKLLDIDAVFTISGPALTYQVGYEMWQHGIPAYGATWDS